MLRGSPLQVMERDPALSVRYSRPSRPEDAFQVHESAPETSIATAIRYYLALASRRSPPKLTKWKLPPEDQRLYSFSAFCIWSCGKPIAVCPSMPVIVLAATIAFTIASSVASTVALKSGVMRSFDTASMVFGPGSALAWGFAVENAIKISPEPLPEVEPVLANPIVARRAMRFN